MRPQLDRVSNTVKTCGTSTRASSVKVASTINLKGKCKTLSCFMFFFFCTVQLPYPRNPNRGNLLIRRKSCVPGTARGSKVSFESNGRPISWLCLSQNSALRPMCLTMRRKRSIPWVSRGMKLDPTGPFFKGILSGPQGIQIAFS